MAAPAPASMPSGWAAVGASLLAGHAPEMAPPLQPDELVLLLGPPAVFWACVWFWQLVVTLFPRHAAAHVLKGPAIRSPSLLKARRAAARRAHTRAAAHRRRARAAQVVSYTLAYQAFVTALQYCMWAAGHGRAPAVEGGFSNAAEWKACAMQLLPALLLMDMYYCAPAACLPVALLLRPLAADAAAASTRAADWCHRFLHLRLPYKYIHKMHHTVHVPYASAAFYLHPAEALLLDHGAAFVAATLFPGMRFWTVLAIQLLLPVRASHEHMGYVYPWDIDARLGTEKVTHHGIHHMPKGARRGAAMRGSARGRSVTHACCHVSAVLACRSQVQLRHAVLHVHGRPVRHALPGRQGQGREGRVRRRRVCSSFVLLSLHAQRNKCVLAARGISDGSASHVHHPS